MNRDRTCVNLGFATTSILLGPIVLILTMPLAVATGHDLFYFGGEAPIALALCGPAAYLLLRGILPRAAARRAAASLELEAADLDQTPNSIR